MKDNTNAPGALEILQTRVYYEAESGEIVHVHRLAVPVGEALDADRIQDEMSTFESSIEQRHGRILKAIDVEESTFDEARGGNISFRVDVDAKRVLRADPAAAE